MESSCAEPPQFWHPKVSSCCATSSRPCAGDTRRRDGERNGSEAIEKTRTREPQRGGAGRGMRETRHASRARCRAADTCVFPTMTSLSRRQTPQATRSDARDATRRRACGSREKKKENTRGSRVFRRARTISSLSRFGGGSATFPSSKSASRRSSSFSDVGSCSAAARSTAACDAFSRFRSSSRSFFVAAASLAFPAGVSSPRCFLCVSNARSHFWYSCLSPDASAARASPASSPAAIAAHALARHAASNPPCRATDSYRTRKSSFFPPNTGHRLTVTFSCSFMNSTYSTRNVLFLPLFRRSCSSFTVCTRVLNANVAGS